MEVEVEVPMRRGEAFFLGCAGFAICVVVVAFLWGVYNIGYRDAMDCVQYDVHCK